MLHAAFHWYRRQGFNATAALAMARNEARFTADDTLRIIWEYDSDPDLSWMTARELTQDHECLIIVLQRMCPHCGAWQNINSMGGIIDPDADYRRVLEAEIMFEISP